MKKRKIDPGPGFPWGIKGQDVRERLPEEPFEPNLRREIDPFDRLRAFEDEKSEISFVLCLSSTVSIR